MAVTVHSWTCWGIIEFRFLLLRYKVQLSQASIVASEWDFLGAQGFRAFDSWTLCQLQQTRRKDIHEVMNVAHVMVFLCLSILHFYHLYNAQCISCSSKFMIKEYFYCACMYSNKYAGFHDLLTDPWHLDSTHQSLQHPCRTMYCFYGAHALKINICNVYMWIHF